MDGIADLDEGEGALDDPETALRSPALRADVWQSVATTAGNAAFRPTTPAGSSIRPPTRPLPYTPS